MSANDRVFVSHTHADNAICQSLRRALQYWGIDCWFDLADAQVGLALAGQFLDAMRDRDVLIRICTPTTAGSVWMQREMGMFLAFQAEKRRRDPAHQGKLISLCFPGYVPDPLEQSYLLRQVPEGPEAAWVDALRLALGRPTHWVVFDRSDEDYLWWVGAYPHGFVVNADRQPMADGLVLHRATCGNVTRNGPPGATAGPGAFTEGRYIKICAEHPSDLERWARQEVGENADLRSDACLMASRLRP